jgi:sugar phosphate isomerase/epimerase
MDGYAMVKEMVSLGFDHIELSHGIRIVLVPGILRAVEEGLVKVSSTHNFCPLPTGITQAAPNLFEPSSSDAREHDQWLRHTKRSIDFAAQVKAKVLVLHLGRAKFFWFNPKVKLRRYLEENPRAAHENDPVYRKLLDRACVRLRERMVPYWAQVLRSLEEIRQHAADKGVALGCENREKFDELPMDGDFETLFTALQAPHTAGYWHDTGHAHLKEEMGLLEHRSQLTRYADRLLGFHLHDVSEDGHDHQPVGSGAIDFEMVSSFWRPHHLLTLELSPRVDLDGVRSSKERIESLMARAGL